MNTASSNTKEILARLQDELDGVLLYKALAEAERDPKLAEVYRRMGDVERRHAEKWRAALQASGQIVPPHRPSFRTRALIWLARRFGASFVLPSVATFEELATHDYGSDAATRDIAADEQSHVRLLQEISKNTRGVEGGVLARLEGRHRSAGGNALRAAVLGANDGLVSNLSLVMGVAGAELAGPAILVTGLAGLLAGACSMALGEWLSVQSSRELTQRQLNIEKAEIANAPEEEAEELALIYQARGLSEGQARTLATQIMQDQANATETLAREELGLDPESLGGSPWEAAITSFVLFSIGAIVPVIPFIFLTGLIAVVTSIALSAIALFVIGAGITLFTGRGLLYSGARQIVFGLAAAAITFGVGRLIGVNLGG